MEIRYKLPTEIQIYFFQHVEEVTGYKSGQLAKVFGVAGRTYRDWKRGKFSAPEHVFSSIERLYKIPLPYPKNKAKDEWIAVKSNSSKIGGFARFKKYGRISTQAGCAKGGHKALELLRARGVVPIAKLFTKPVGYSEWLAEYVGVLLGDGHIGRRQWTITINARADKDYLPFLVQLIETLFHFTPSVRYREKYNVNIIYSGGKEYIEYLQSLGLVIGNKVKQQVGIPEWIKANNSFRIACLRGLMDTDGGIFIHRYVVNRKEYSYRKLCFVNCSFPILDFVLSTLKMINLHPTLHLKQSSKRVWLSNQDEVKEYLLQVGTHNQRLLKQCII